MTIKPIYIYIKEPSKILYNTNSNQNYFIILSTNTFNNPKANDYKFQVLSNDKFGIFISESVFNNYNILFWTKPFTLPDMYLDDKRLIIFDELLLLIKDIKDSFHYNKDSLIKLLQLVIANWDDWY
jgi:hypothetical protein